ncbi:MULTISPECIES: NAD-dependent epimerase/dehydratase family protein [unclassified Kosakonia]|uniref:NAD-dependent epimerase/dehydratase family protein n=1 Tax=unclassified Kosakonia TaxID=2632876 RepID=UPI0031B6F2E1
MQKKALIVGISGVIGRALAEKLLADGWQVTGLSRGRGAVPADCTSLTADLTDAAAVNEALKSEKPDALFFSVWARQENEKANIRVNGAMVKNVIDALGERLAGAKKYGYRWSVHRPHSIIGYALGNAMNMGQTLAVYATLCREKGWPFIFPGSPEQWNGVSDVTDAGLLAEQLSWAAVSDGGANEDFNAVNGDVFRWNWLWPRLAAYFGIEAAAFPASMMPLEGRMQEAQAAWTEIADKYQLAESDIGKLASWWHTDADLGRPMEAFADMSKSRKAGFTGYRSTLDSFTALFDRLKAENIIPR